MSLLDRRGYVHISKTFVYVSTFCVFVISFFTISIIYGTFFSKLPVTYDFKNADYVRISPHIGKIWLRRTVNSTEVATLFISRMIVNSVTDEQIILPSSEEVVKPGAHNVNRVFYVPPLSPGEWCFVVTTRWRPSISISDRTMELPRMCFNVEEVKDDVTK